MPKQYALVNENNVVINTVLFDEDTTPELFQIITEANGAVAYYSIEEYGLTGIGGSFDNGRLWAVSPYPSWIKDMEKNCWIEPIPYPNDGFIYTWDESIINWVKKDIPSE